MAYSKDKVVIQSRDGKSTQALSSLNFSTFQLTRTKNEAYQVDFQAYDDGSLGFALLQVENLVEYDGQTYVIKQATDDNTGGVHSVTVTATHIFYQLNNRFQYNVRQGDNSFSLTDALNFLLTDIGDGYSYQIHGKFDSNKTLTDFGNTSIIEGLSTIKSAFGVYAIVPDNKIIHLYDKDSYVTNTRKIFRYRNDTAAVQLQYDATSIVNTVQAVSTAEKPAFSPFKVQDADSVAKWGIKEGARVESDSVTSVDAMKSLASQSFVLEPSLAMTVTSAGNEDVALGENWTVQMIDNGFQTSVEVVSIVRAPFATSAVQITLNNTRKNYLDAQRVQQSAIDMAKKNTGTTGNMWVIGKVES